VTLVNASYWNQLFVFDFSGNSEYLNGKLSFMDLATPQISLIVFWSVMIIMALFAYLKQFSLIPLMGLATCLYLLTGMTKSNWAWFLGWLLLGLLFYFIYGFRKSRLASVN